MAGNSKQKLKLLYLLQMLEKETDAEQGLTMADILTNLAEHGISAERKSIYRDINTLREFGCEVETYKRKPVEYALTPDIDLPELMLLVDAVQGSKFLTEEMSNSLTASVQNLASVRQQKFLRKCVHVEGRITSQSDSVFTNVDIIHEAMQKGRKVEFMYYKYGTDKTRKIQHDGKPYIHTPIRVVYADGFYYLITWNDHKEAFVTFRLDRIQELKISEEPAMRNAKTANYSTDHFKHKSFGMFDGEVTSATLLVKAHAMDAIIDTFGHDVKVKTLSDEEAEVYVSVYKSYQFFGWIAGFNGDVRIKGTASLVHEYQEWLKSLLDE